MDLLLWILAVVLVVAGVLALFRRQILWGIVLIIVGLLVGPGGSVSSIDVRGQLTFAAPPQVAPPAPAAGRAIAESVPLRRRRT